jgi:hypothetical protein
MKAPHSDGQLVAIEKELEQALEPLAAQGVDVLVILRLPCGCLGSTTNNDEATKLAKDWLSDRLRTS